MTDAAYNSHYFVDEAGDLAIFDKEGRSLVGREGVSYTFMVGACHLLGGPEAVAAQVTALRADLLADPYFAGVPSMQLERGKTAFAFHAKDDPPEVRREVFKLITATPLEMFVAVRRKAKLYEEGRVLRARTGRKRTSGEIYDDLVTEVFKNRLHLADCNQIIFARRGQSVRNIALHDAIRRAKDKFNDRWKKGVDKPTTISSSVPSETHGLQIADYCLWALQRMIERREDRFFNMIADKFKVVLDRDDMRRNGYGEYYTHRNPLTLERLMPVL